MSEHYSRVLKHLQHTRGTGNVLEALDWDASKFEEAFLLANEMQNLNYVKLLYSNFNKNLIVVEMTLVGMRQVNTG